MSLSTPRGARSEPHPAATPGARRHRDLNAPDDTGDSNAPWRTLSRQQIHLARFPLVEPRGAGAAKAGDGIVNTGTIGPRVHL